MKRFALLFPALLTLASPALTTANAADSPSPELIHLGRKLFFDPELSSTGQTSCASCHRPELGWTDGLARGVGTHGDRLARRTPTLLDVKGGFSFFWDGRAKDLEEQALGPIQNPKEMDQPVGPLLERLQKHEFYPALFQKAFGSIEITSGKLAQAIAAFERTITHEPTAYEAWLNGKDGAISESAERGFKLFFSSRARCFHCHNGENFSDQRFWDIGVDSQGNDDRGRGVFYPDLPKFQYTFKTPVLWGISKRGPYMHNGSEATLQDVIDFYDKGGRIQRESHAPLIQPIGLTDEEKSDLVEFLRTL